MAAIDRELVDCGCLLDAVSTVDRVRLSELAEHGVHLVRHREGMGPRASRGNARKPRHPDSGHVPVSPPQDPSSAVTRAGHRHPPVPVSPTYCDQISVPRRRSIRIEDVRNRIDGVDQAGGDAAGRGTDHPDDFAYDGLAFVPRAEIRIRRRRHRRLVEEGRERDVYRVRQCGPSLKGSCSETTRIVGRQHRIRSSHRKDQVANRRGKPVRRIRQGNAVTARDERRRRLSRGGDAHEAP